MKKLMITLAVMAMTAGAAMAQSNDNNKECTKDCPNIEQCQKQKDCKKADCKKDCKKADCKKEDCKKACDAKGACEFEGLNLTDAQKEQIKNIKEEQKAQCQAKKEAAKAQKEACKADRQEARKAYLAKIKNVLTPEQYVQYLENQATSGHKGQMKAGRHDMKRFDKNAPRKVCERAPQAVKAAKVQEAQNVK